jgi:DNA-binding transcriptional LysR family regulator
LEIEDLRLFLAAVRMGSISAAARSAARSQPAVSRRIRNLERELGVELLDRSKSVVTPTSQGWEFLRFATNVIMQYEALQGKLAAATPFTAHLGIAASTTPGEYWLPNVLPEFQANNPGIQLALSVMDSAAVEECAAERRCDLGFIGRSPAPTSAFALLGGSRR